MSSPEMTPPAEFPPPLPSPQAVAPLPPPAARAAKAPWIALLLSLVMPGLGQVYNGQIAKALTFFAAFSGSIYLVAEGHPLPFGIVLPFIFFWNMVDAYRSAMFINARGLATTTLEDEVESPAWGIALAAMGLLLLLNNLGWLRLAELARFWPVLLIGAGLVLLRRSLQRKVGNGPSV